MEVDGAGGAGGAALPGGGGGQGGEFRLHPLVLINLSDHLNRTLAPGAAPAWGGRVLGVLLGEQKGRAVEITNSFELLFEEAADTGALTADGEVLAQKMEQYKRVFPRLDVVGWYTTGGGLQDSYLEFHKVISAHNASPVLLLMDPNFTHHAKDLPITLYETGLHVIDGNPSVIFVQAAYSIETSEEERVAVDHIAKIAPKVDTNAAVLGAHLEKMIESVTMLHEKIGKVYTLLQEMKAGTVPKDHQFLRGAATLIQSLPLATDAVQKELLIEQMDGLLVTYLATMTKGTATVNALADKMAVSYDRGARRRAL